MIFVSYHQAAEVLEPCKQAFNFVSSFITTQRSTILRRGFASIALVRGNHRHITFFGQAFIQRVTVVRFVTNYIFRNLFQETGIQRSFHQGYFVGASRDCVNGDRKTFSVCKAHDFGAFAPFGLAHTIAPFLAGAKVPSMKPSLRSMPPRSRKSLANAVRILAKTPDSVQCWKRRWHVLLEGYRWGRSAQGAPVRSIHRMPFNMALLSSGGRPDVPGSALGFGKYSAIRCHCSFVKSMNH